MLMTKNFKLSELKKAMFSEIDLPGGYWWGWGLTQRLNTAGQILIYHPVNAKMLRPSWNDVSALFPDLSAL